MQDIDIINQKIQISFDDSRMKWKAHNLRYDTKHYYKTLTNAMKSLKRNDKKRGETDTSNAILVTTYDVIYRTPTEKLIVETVLSNN